LTREQFGRPVGRFQAVQAHVLSLGQAAQLSANAVMRAAWASPTSTTATCAMWLVVVEQAMRAVRAVHQAHGAIGLTREYPLHRWTRRLSLWATSAGPVRGLETELGTAVLRDERSATDLVGEDCLIEEAGR